MLDDKVTSAVWDAQGQLLVGREGWIERYRLEDIAAGRPTFRLDLGPLKPAAREPK